MRRRSRKSPAPLSGPPVPCGARVGAFALSACQSRCIQAHFPAGAPPVPRAARFGAHWLDIMKRWSVLAGRALELPPLSACQGRGIKVEFVAGAPPVPSVARFGAHWLDIMQRWSRFLSSPPLGPPPFLAGRALELSPLSACQGSGIKVQFLARAPPFPSAARFGAHCLDLVPRCEGRPPSGGKGEW